jgi:hypothetical protein
MPPLCAPRRSYLPPEHLFNLSDFFLHFAGELFISAFGSHPGVLGDLAGLLFHEAFRLVQVAFDLVLRALLHYGFS